MQFYNYYAMSLICFSLSFYVICTKAYLVLGLGLGLGLGLVMINAKYFLIFSFR